jgi:uncharacterized protein (DUF2384 family)
MPRRAQRAQLRTELEHLAPVPRSHNARSLATEILARRIADETTEPSESECLHRARTMLDEATAVFDGERKARREAVPPHWPNSAGTNRDRGARRTE